MSSVEYLKLPALQYAHCQCIFRPQAVLCSTIWFMGFQSETCNKFFPSLKVQTQPWCIINPFFHLKWLAGSPAKFSGVTTFPWGGFAKKGQKDLRIFQPGISWASGISKEGPSGRRQMWLDIWISGYFPGIKPIHGSKSLCVQGIALKWTISLFCK